jgi:hypothetical protein
VRAFVCLIEARLHFGESHDLKGKRKELKSLKEGLRRRFGAAVAETEGHDTWHGSSSPAARTAPASIGRCARSTTSASNLRTPWPPSA